MITINYNVLICFLPRRADRPRQYKVFYIQSVYENKVNGKMPEKTCFEFIDKYSAEKEIFDKEQKK